MGFQVKVKDQEGNEHYERWSASRITAEEALEAALADPAVAGAWIVPDE